MQQLGSISDFEQLEQAFIENKSWDKQYRLIIQLGKLLDSLPASLKSEANQVKGCESLAWLVISEQNDHYDFAMDSDTRVVKGLMKIVSLIFQGKTKQQIEQIDCNELFKRLGLLSHLSPSRANGLFAIIHNIKGVNHID
ncbi:SufE family protein [Psychromonas sp. SP041]|uniref:SufE family protein n=1 Tax=Psychromonas sp. SP041 TaxID=1365007 RepID=UPI000427F174|nr:SufE family protein [Psychromonas sp. SP041]